MRVKKEDEKKDLNFLAKTLEKIFFEIGFSAKKSSEFGVSSKFKGKISIPFKKIKNKKFSSFIDFLKIIHQS